MIISSKTKLSQLYKALIFYFGCEYIYIYDGKLINENDDRNVINGSTIISEKISENINIGLIIFGKEITLKIKMENSNEENKYFNYKVGILNSVKEFLKIVESLIERKVKGFYLDKREIIIEEDRSFASLGIINDSEIKPIIENKK